MKLGTHKNGTRDGKLVVVSRDLSHVVDATSVAPTLQAALDNWDEVAPKLNELYEQANGGAGEAFDLSLFSAPLPRAYEWIDGSAYINHIVLVRAARGAKPPETLKTSPLVYQGGSGKLLGPTDDIEHFSESFGIDFESEIVVFTADTPMGTKAADASKYIRLVGIINDVSLRALIPGELAKNFGFFVSKPATAFSPVLVTPDELGDAWKDGRVHLELTTHYNGELYGHPNAGPEMFFGFNELVEHVTQTRNLTAGTIIGSGTVSNEDRSVGSSCLAEKRMIEKIDTGEFKTPFMKFGDTVRIEMLDKDGKSIFGTIDQKVVEKKQ